MNIEIKDYLEYKQEEIIKLYKSVGWTNYTEHPERLKVGYKNSLCVLAAYEEERLVGIIRLLVMELPNCIL